MLGAPTAAGTATIAVAQSQATLLLSAHVRDDCADLRIALAQYEKAILTWAATRCGGTNCSQLPRSLPEPIRGGGVALRRPRGQRLAA